MTNISTPVFSPLAMRRWLTEMGVMVLAVLLWIVCLPFILPLIIWDFFTVKKEPIIDDETRWIEPDNSDDDETRWE